MIIVGPILKLFEYWYISVPAIIVLFLLNRKYPGIIAIAVVVYYVLFCLVISPWLALGAIAFFAFVWFIGPRADSYTTYNSYREEDECPYCGSGDNDGNHCNNCGGDF
jgi:hypothetical protein